MKMFLLIGTEFSRKLRTASLRFLFPPTIKQNCSFYTTKPTGALKILCRLLRQQTHKTGITLDIKVLCEDQFATR